MLIANSMFPAQSGLANAIAPGHPKFSKFSNFHHFTHVRNRIGHHVHFGKTPPFSPPGRPPGGSTPPPGGGSPPGGPPPGGGTSVNLKDFGAVGDGTKDCAPAFAAALNAAGQGGTVNVGAGTYALYSDVNVTTGAHIAGAGASTVLEATQITTGNRTMLTISGPGGGVSNLVISANYGGKPAFYINGIRVQNTTASFVLDHVTFNSTLQVAASLINANGVTITNDVFNAANGACIFCQGVNNLKVFTNVFNQLGLNGILGYAPQSTNFDIEGNQFNIGSGDNYATAITLGGVTNLTIANNKAVVPADAYLSGFTRLVGGDPSYNGWGPISNVNVVNNECDNCGFYGTGAIWIEASSSGGSGIVSNVTISGNTITETVQSSIQANTSLSSGIMCQGELGVPSDAIKGLVIENNSIIGAGYWGIRTDSSSDVQILKNAINSCSGTPVGVAGTCAGMLTITGNTSNNCAFDTVADAQKWHVPMGAVIQIDAPTSGPSSLKNVVVTNNSYTGQKNNLNWDVDDNVSVSKVPTTHSGNTNPDLLPDYFAP
jgi:hypothetical protein